MPRNVYLIRITDPTYSILHISYHPVFQPPKHADVPKRAQLLWADPRTMLTQSMNSRVHSLRKQKGRKEGKGRGEMGELFFDVESSVKVRGGNESLLC